LTLPDEDLLVNGRAHCLDPLSDQLLQRCVFTCCPAELAPQAEAQLGLALDEVLDPVVVQLGLRHFNVLFCSLDADPGRG